MLNKLKKVKFKDIFDIYKYILCLIPALIYKIFLKIRKKELWLICETENTARDNGYAFYKYMLENHPKDKFYYAINFKCKDYTKFDENDNHLVKWSSIKHYFLYMSATKNLSSHKEGNPNQTLFTILHLYLNMYNNRVFLQHGITANNLLMFHKENAKFCVFIAGAKPEAEYLTSQFNYNNNEVRYTGFARFDNLYGNTVDDNLILFMPTWRRWLTKDELLVNSEYYKHIESLLSNRKLNDILNKYNKKLVFCAHGGLRKVCGNFKTNLDNIEILDINSTDVQELLKKGSILITDYSSIHFDFAYMEKPVLYYQYDVQDFLEKHIGARYKETYYKYEKDCFGPIAYEEDDLINYLENIIKDNNKLEQKYLDRINAFFELRDRKNCERIYLTLKENKNEN